MKKSNYRIINCSCGEQINSKSIKNHLYKIHKIEKNNIDLEFYNIMFRDLNIEEIISLYKEGNCVNFLCNKFNLKGHDIILILKINNIKKRTNSESKKTEKYIKKYTDTIKDKYQTDNVSKLEWVKEKKVDTMLKNFNRVNNFCDDEIRNKAISNIDHNVCFLNFLLSIKDKYGADCLVNIPGVRKKISDSHLFNYKFIYSDEKKEDIKTHLNNISKLSKYRRVSKLELRVQNILNILNCKYECNTNIVGYNFDLIFDNKIILEINGDYWHANPSIYKENDIISYPNNKIVKAIYIWDKDKYKKELVEKEGYKLFYLWESDIKKMTDLEIIDFLRKIKVII